MQTHHVGIDRREDFTSQSLQPSRQSSGKRMCAGEPGEVVCQSVVCLRRQYTGLADPSSKRLFKPFAPSDKRFRADDCSGHQLLLDSTTHDPIGAPIPFDKHSEAVSNGSSSSVILPSAFSQVRCCTLTLSVGPPRLSRPSLCHPAPLPRRSTVAHRLSASQCRAPLPVGRS